MSFAVYVHFPWCVQRCPYCDFATVAELPAKIPHAPYADAVVREWGLRAATLGRPETLFFGGGTPSLWTVPELGKVVAAVDARGEVTVECNPTSLTRDRAKALQDNGVNRLSIGVQSLRDEHLRYLGRLHDAAGALAAVRAATSVDGLRVSADLMFGMNEQSTAALLEDARALVDAGVEHLSCYALTIEPATRFGEMARKGKLPRMTDDAVAEMYLALESALASLGFTHYEVSNYARPGGESDHNRAYWRGDAYVGLGAGAVGCVETTAGEAFRWRNHAETARYLEALGDGRLPPSDEETLDAETRVRESLLLGMRSVEGTHLPTIAARTGLDPRKGRERALAREVSRGNVVATDEVWRIPQDRWLLADDITARMF